MEMRHGMPVWAPTDAEMDLIRRRVSRERAMVAREIFQAMKRWFHSRSSALPAAPVLKIRTPFYY